MSSSRVSLRWTEALTFQGGAEGGPEITVASGGGEGPSPTQLLMLSLAGCMGVDMVMILEKSRVKLEQLEVVVVGERRAEPPRRFVAMRLTFRIRGPSERHSRKVQRALDLSRDKYCSVLHTLDPDLHLDFAIERI
jgi:putative redox protein